MNFLDAIVSPFPSGTSSTVILAVGLTVIGLICAGTAALLIVHIRKEQKQAEKRRRKATENDEE